MPNGFSDNFTIFILPLMGIVIYFGMNQLVKFPNLFNYSVSITRENPQRHYELATKMIRFIKLAILIIFMVIILMTYLLTYDWHF